MVALRLIPIAPNGAPAEETGPLPELATSVCATTAALYENTGYVPPWTGYLAVNGHTVVGTCAFKTPPADGRVEIAYFTFPEFEGRGIATAMAREMVNIARTANPALDIVAQTLPLHTASTSILQKLGFALHGSVDHPEDGEVWEWRLASGK